MTGCTGPFVLGNNSSRFWKEYFNFNGRKDHGLLRVHASRIGSRQVEQGLERLKESSVAYAYVERRILLNYTHFERCNCSSERDACLGGNENIEERHYKAVAREVLLEMNLMTTKRRAM